ncbi:MAG: glycerate kinase [Candidatus Izemoplasmatales bacterium]|jgi:glycerate kinase|nr:glycerate kinase [Candidatus Izemoplasmatales bacterium]
MKFIVSMDSYKGSLNQKELGDIIEKKIKTMLPDSTVINLPMADGGEGTLDCFIESLDAKIINVEVHDPLMRKLKTYYAIKDNTAIIEMAKSSGLTLLKAEEKSINKTTTYGVGEMIKDALDRGILDFIITIGGSATNDGGIGMLSALGAKFYDKNNILLQPIGESLQQIEKIDIKNFDKRLTQATFKIACDVDNPLSGPNGATFIYGPQKGGSKDDILIIDHGLINYSKVANKLLKVDFSNHPGAGAAGGLGYAFKTFFNSRLIPGVDIMIERINIKSHLKDTDYIITGEGKIDYQSVMGKVISGIGKLGKNNNIPVIAIAGSIDYVGNELYDLGITNMFSILPQGMSIEEAMQKENTIKNLEMAIEKIIRLINKKEW